MLVLRQRFGIKLSIADIGPFLKDDLLRLGLWGGFGGGPLVAPRGRLRRRRGGGPLRRVGRCRRIRDRVPLEHACLTVDLSPRQQTFHTPVADDHSQLPDVRFQGQLLLCPRCFGFKSFGSVGLAMFLFCGDEFHTQATSRELALMPAFFLSRSEERRVGKECRSRW